MNAITAMPDPATASASSMGRTGQLRLEIVGAEPGDGAHFRGALERHMQAVQGAGAISGGGNNASLGEKIMTRATSLASEIKSGEQHVSKILEQATRSADPMHLMKAMLALNEYQMRVQFVSKTASKAASSIDQLTKLQ